MKKTNIKKISEEQAKEMLNPIFDIGEDSFDDNIELILKVWKEKGWVKGEKQ